MRKSSDQDGINYQLQFRHSQLKIRHVLKVLVTSPPQKTTRSPRNPAPAPHQPFPAIPPPQLSDTKFSATSGRKISIVTAPLVITSHLCFSRQDVRNLIFSLLFSSIKTVGPFHKTAWCVQTAVMPWKEDRRLLSSSCTHYGSSSSKLILRTIACNAEVIQIHVCTLVLFAEDTRSDLPRPAVPHDDVLKVGGKVDQASNLRKLVGRWVGQKQFRQKACTPNEKTTK